MDDKLTALAAACERAAELLDALSAQYALADDTPERALGFERDATALRAHARALREGHVTVHEGGDRERV